jgi:bifunctional non-homologous end joining protein LigD
VKAHLPDIEPIKPVAGKLPTDPEAWQFEMKYDGYRGLFYMEEKRCQVFSKQRKLLHQFEPLCRQVRDLLGVKTAIFDGEIVARDASRRPIFADLHRRRRQPMYIAFDLLYLDGVDLRKLPLRERRAKLEALVPEDGTVVERSLAVPAAGELLYETMFAHDLEGIVGKRLKDPYASGVKWIKIKNRAYTQEIGRDKLFGRGSRSKDI